MVGEKKKSSEDNAVLTKLSHMKAFCDRTICLKGSYWLTSPTLSEGKTPLYSLALKFLLSER